jgi:hypothetical protein
VAPTGKLDRVELRRLATAQAAARGRSPSSDLERQICAGWSQLLKAPVQDVDANFFDIGGHSLLAARAVSELRQRTGLRLSMRHLLASPTAAGLAAEISALAGQQAPDGQPPRRVLP